LEIELTAQAEADLVEMGDFIARDNPSAAERYIRRLRHRIEFPEAGHPIRRKSNKALRGVRLVDRESIDLFMESLPQVVLKPIN